MPDVFGKYLWGWQAGFSLFLLDLISQGKVIKNFALDLHLEHGFSVCCKLSALRELLWDHVVVIWSECFGNKAWAEWKSLKIACLIMCTSFKRLKFHPGTFSTSKSKVLIIWSMLEIVPHAHFTDAQTGCCGWEAILQEKPSQERKVMSNIAPSSIHRVCREGKWAICDQFPLNFLSTWVSFVFIRPKSDQSYDQIAWNWQN